MLHRIVIGPEPDPRRGRTEPQRFCGPRGVHPAAPWIAAAASASATLLLIAQLMR